MCVWNSLGWSTVCRIKLQFLSIRGSSWSASFSSLIISFSLSCSLILAPASFSDPDSVMPLTLLCFYHFRVLFISPFPLIYPSHFRLFSSVAFISGPVFALFKVITYIVDLQCCVNYCCTAKCLSYTYVCILFHVISHYGLSQDIEFMIL